MRLVREFLLNKILLVILLTMALLLCFVLRNANYVFLLFWGNTDLVFSIIFIYYYGAEIKKNNSIFFLSLITLMIIGVGCISSFIIFNSLDYKIIFVIMNVLFLAVGIFIAVRKVCEQKYYESLFSNNTPLYYDEEEYNNLKNLICDIEYKSDEKNINNVLGLEINTYIRIEPSYIIVFVDFSTNANNNMICEGKVVVKGKFILDLPTKIRKSCRCVIANAIDTESNFDIEDIEDIFLIIKDNTNNKVSYGRILI